MQHHNAATGGGRLVTLTASGKFLLYVQGLTVCIVGRLLHFFFTNGYYIAVMQLPQTSRGLQHWVMFAYKQMTLWHTLFQGQYDVLCMLMS